MKVKVETTITIAGGHKLHLPYESKCKNLHGHNWKITVTVGCDDTLLGETGMVVDFTKIKEAIRHLDHRLLNDFIPQPTAENIGLYVWKRIEAILPEGRKVEQVVVEETDGNRVIVEP
jgi:6-pyruvoyltetrahydropterin/6-carboxytetrahydropterin synthase